MSARPGLLSVGTRHSSLLSHGLAIPEASSLLPFLLCIPLEAMDVQSGKKNRLCSQQY